MAPVIDTQDRLDQLITDLDRAPWIAMDTEADSLYAYPERLCLIQLSLPGRDALVDSLSPRIDLTPLFDLLAQREIILHGADYDLRLLYKTHRFKPTEVFDTMLAARLLGERSFGLANVARKYLDVTLEKTSQKANWARRPLPDKLRRYARDDTRFLRPLAELLRADLSDKGRLAWHAQTCDRLIEECAQLKEPDPDRDWRIKGSVRLDRRGLAVLRELWQWREKEALRANRPPYFVVSHERLVAIADGAASEVPFSKLPIPRKLSRKRTDGLLRAVARALRLPKRAWPPERPPADTSAGPCCRIDERALTELRRRRDRRAADLGIDPVLIASRGTLERLARSWDSYSGELMPWQRELLSAEG